MSSETVDLICGLLGMQVLKESKTLKWKNNHITILPTLSTDENVNACDSVDIPIIRFMAQFPPSLSSSKNVLHLKAYALAEEDILDVVGNALRSNIPIVISGVAYDGLDGDPSVEYLDKYFAISPNRPHLDVIMQSIDHVNPTINGTIESFFDSMTDPTSIQCILDIPLAQTSLPWALQNIDHGIVHGWNQSVHTVPISSNVHPHNFTVRGWGMAHQAGFLMYPHHDVEGTLTWVRMEVGVKFWVLFWLKDQHDDWSHIQNIATQLINFVENKAWLKKHCNTGLITLRPGDMLIQPPGTMHAVYTPVASFATGGHFYHYLCMHLTELARYIDVKVGDSMTNQALDHALETLRHMVIAIPYLSSTISLSKRPLLSLCMMATSSKHYHAKGSNHRSVCDRETAKPSMDISDVILEFLGTSQWVSASHILYQGNQFTARDLVDRKELDRALTQSLEL
ncbi:uncharacterized protein F5147DRAFT_773843 [Suillus discolor]|uniref:JmjC domain-containing protein n=1 Tax=Suillus discolor TaxID=1912936 RepID=A0A9P7JTP5_9AGAM|nr:uncharacterized protein F5147DRAFT_773843 [Suillus discolor]KAG2108259.1 hypothetical protein F5147DRAFT_773843 [Suillus discolor]